MTDTDFSSSAADGAAPPVQSPAVGGGAGAVDAPASQPDSGNQFSGDTRTVDAHHGPSRDGRDDGERPRDLDQPAEWGPEAGLRAEEIIKELVPPQPPARPEKMPRSWSNEEIDDWNALTPAAQERQAAREAKRDADISRRYSELAEHTRAAEFTLRHAEQTNQQALQALVPGLAEYADLFEPGAFGQEQQRNPERARQFEELFNRVESLRLTGQQIIDARTEHQQAAVQQQYAAVIERARQAWAEEKAREDAAFAKLVPAAADPAKAEGIEKRVKSRLREELGVSQEEFDRLWETTPILRGAKTRQLVHESNMWREAKRAAFEARPVPVRKPMLPGTNNSVGGRGDDALAAAKSGDMSAYFRIRDSQDRRARR